jgi:hypothetical protein
MSQGLIVYLTAAAEDRCRREMERAEAMEEIYGEAAGERIREKALKRLAPYRHVWQELGKQGDE